MRISHPLICEQDRERRINREISLRERERVFIWWRERSPETRERERERVCERRTFFVSAWAPAAAETILFFSPAFLFVFPFFFLRYPSCLGETRQLQKKKKKKKKRSKRKRRGNLASLFLLFVYFAFFFPPLTRSAGSIHPPTRNFFFPSSSPTNSHHSRGSSGSSSSGSSSSSSSRGGARAKGSFSHSLLIHLTAR